MRKNSRVMHTSFERIEQVMIYAQLDLAAAINYRVGLPNSFDIVAAQKTLEELYAITGDPAGKDLMHRELDQG